VRNAFFWVATVKGGKQGVQAAAPEEGCGMRARRIAQRRRGNAVLWVKLRARSPVVFAGAWFGPERMGRRASPQDNRGSAQTRMHDTWGIARREAGRSSHFRVALLLLLRRVVWARAHGKAREPSR
jgi:hypothetical protein